MWAAHVRRVAVGGPCASSASDVGCDAVPAAATAHPIACTSGGAHLNCDTPATRAYGDSTLSICVSNGGHVAIRWHCRPVTGVAPTRHAPRLGAPVGIHVRLIVCWRLRHNRGLRPPWTAATLRRPFAVEHRPSSIDSAPTRSSPPISPTQETPPSPLKPPPPTALVDARPSDGRQLSCRMTTQ